MEHFKIFKKRRPSPGELNISEKCAHCGAGFVDFSDIFGDGRLLGCRGCGSVFMSKACRENEKKESLKPVNPLSCDICSFVAKSKAGLVAHMRSHG